MIRSFVQPTAKASNMSSTHRFIKRRVFSAMIENLESEYYLAIVPEKVYAQAYQKHWVENASEVMVYAGVSESELLCCSESKEVLCPRSPPVIHIPLNWLCGLGATSLLSSIPEAIEERFELLELQREIEEKEWDVGRLLTTDGVPAGVLK